MKGTSERVLNNVVAIIPLFIEWTAHYPRSFPHNWNSGGREWQAQGMAVRSITRDAKVRSIGGTRREPKIGNQTDQARKSHSQIHPVMQLPTRGNSNFSTNSICATGKTGMHNGELELHDSYDETREGTINHTSSLDGHGRRSGGMEWGY